MNSIKKLWLLWLVVSILVVTYLTYNIGTDEKQAFLPGKATHGHHQIEMSCASCHAEPFGGADVIQGACINCHGADLKEARDSHPKSKFTNPRNASRVKVLDARECITCHTEHKHEITQSMGVTLPDDFCFKCHADIEDDRPSHKGIDFKTCATGGCHNYHDNRALYEDFLAKHLNDDVMIENGQNPSRSLANDLVLMSNYPVKRYPLKAITENSIDPLISVSDKKNVKKDWLITSHSKAGVNCSACHNEKQNNGKIVWSNKPSYETCRSCHSFEVEGFLSGKHGMRLKEGLGAMTPEMARQPMRKDAHGKQLSCGSCHTAHNFDVRDAAVEACLNCHNDKHSRAYKKSPHFNTWHAEITGKSMANTGVSCATCHMPRKEVKNGDVSITLAEHNQNMNLRPNEKMVREVCMNCHGLGFSIDALADKKLIEGNFSGVPSVHIESLNMVTKRLSNSKKLKEEDR